MEISHPSQKPLSALLAKIKKHIKRYEGFVSLVYDCPAGYASVGYGRNLETKGITKEEAEYLLLNDIQDSVNFLSKKFSNFDNFPDFAKIALIDMHFNLGSKGLSNFKKMCKAVKEENWELASQELLDSKYATQVKKRARMNASYFLACVE